MSTDPLGPEWAHEPDGTRTRSASRVVLLDEAGHVLLLRGSDPAVPGSHWWFTVGGGRAPGEDARRAAVRELREETGLVAEPGELQGPVWVRTAHFSFLGASCRQDEEFFVLRRCGRAVLSRERWTPLERDSISELRWWSLADLDATTEAVYPPALAALLRDLPAPAPPLPRRIA